MRNNRVFNVLVICIAIVATVAASIGILSQKGPGPFEFRSIHGESVKIYGHGIYSHMSVEVAPQGIAQDYVTLFIAVPLLLIFLFRSRNGSIRARLILSGILGYFLLTYLFYVAMAMYNPLFLVYIFLLGTSFFSLIISLQSLSAENLATVISSSSPVSFSGGFLIFNAFAVALMWLGIIVPPLMNGSVYPKSLEHYTTLIVQGFDLGLALPLSAISGIYLFRRKPLGLLIGPIYLVFLSLLMTALVAKIIALGMRGYNIVPAVFIIPAFAILAMMSTCLLLCNSKRDQEV